MEKHLQCVKMGEGKDKTKLCSTMVPYLFKKCNYQGLNQENTLGKNTPNFYWQLLSLNASIVSDFNFLSYIIPIFIFNIYINKGNFYLKNHTFIITDYKENWKMETRKRIPYICPSSQYLHSKKKFLLQPSRKNTQNKTLYFCLKVCHSIFQTFINFLWIIY